MDIKKIDKNMDDSKNSASSQVKYVDLNNEYLRGVAFYNGFKRLGVNDFVSEKVNVLQKHTSGLNITFKTNSSFIKVKALLDGPSYMAHMTATGTIGFDLYVQIDGRFIFLNTTKINKADYDIVLVDNLPREERVYRLYFPLYQSVKEAHLGLDSMATIKFIKEKQERVVIYGTSITQGGCATRPGMSYTNILDRNLPYEIINLGFSGSAHLEMEMADILNRIDCKHLILEVEANNTKDDLVHKLPVFLEKLQAKSIFLISHFPYTMSLIEAQTKETLDFLRDFQSKMMKVTFIDGNALLCELGYEDTVDGVHLTDLGFYVLANKLKTYLN